MTDDGVAAVMTPKIMTGGCQCGRVRFAVPIANDDADLCHCRMCQRASGNVSIAFVTLAKADVTWTVEPDWYASSDRARRPFCRVCGTPLGFAYHAGETMDLHVATFDDPTMFSPRQHFGVISRLDRWRDTVHLPDHQPDTATAPPPDG